ncbi:MAG: hypothetical protein GY896_01135 [Gammaproteobacteria bacterium]|nr:hypothetical protein [Gammaproteobacteria bacterium]
MKASDIFHKTTKGQSEIENKSNALTLKQRRVLILINGKNDAATLKQNSLCDNLVETLEVLLSNEFIDRRKAPGERYDHAPQAVAGRDSSEPSPAEFMCNTLLTFANRIKVGKLIEEINATQDMDNLKDLVKSWYHAISETPGGMYQADDLRKRLLEMIEKEDLSG